MSVVVSLASRVSQSLVRLSLVGASLMIAALLNASLFVAPLMARDQIRVVGSSTVFPFVALAAEQFGEKTEFRTPIVEENGTGGGIALFCSGKAPKTPADVANASRPMKPVERALCAEHGITEIQEIPFGVDGIVMANTRRMPQEHFTLLQLFMALAKQVPKDGQLIANPYERWSEIDPALPDRAIEVYGPPPSSGTRDSLVEILGSVGCKLPEYVAAYPDEAKRKEACHALREDGPFIEGREDDNIIVMKLGANPDAFGLFGYSYLDQNMDRVQGNPVDGVLPTYENISNGSYPLARTLYVYIKLQAIDKIPGLAAFAKELESDDAVGEEGYLTLKGLIALPKKD
ncbi:MAG: substrate-binding domain-containing protein [Rickettsiales bacterium]|nr:substrate-binding domain-containing protein [Rickettsiales bacterium]